MEDRFMRGGPVEPEPSTGVARLVERFLAAIGRLLGLAAIAAGLSATFGLLIGWWKGTDLADAVTRGLYIGGALLVAVPLLSAGGQTVWGWSSSDVAISTTTAESRWQRQKRLGVALLVGVLVLLLGFVVDRAR